MGWNQPSELFSNSQISAASSAGSAITRLKPLAMTSSQVRSSMVQILVTSSCLILILRVFVELASVRSIGWLDTSAVGMEFQVGSAVLTAVADDVERHDLSGVVEIAVVVVRRIAQFDPGTGGVFAEIDQDLVALGAAVPPGADRLRLGIRPASVATTVTGSPVLSLKL